MSVNFIEWFQGISFHSSYMTAHWNFPSAIFVRKCLNFSLTMFWYFILQKWYFELKKNDYSILNIQLKLLRTLWIFQDKRFSSSKCVLWIARIQWIFHSTHSTRHHRRVHSARMQRLAHVGGDWETLARYCHVSESKMIYIDRIYSRRRIFDSVNNQPNRSYDAE